MATPTETVKDLAALRKEKEAALLSLGKLMHKMIRDGQIKDEAGSRLAERIATIDKELYLGASNRVPGQGDGICPSCGEALSSPMAAFCGSCGTNVKDFYARDMQACPGCGQLTAAAGAYCTICGMRRGA